MEDAIVIVILLVVIGAAITYIIKSKKSGVKCIGCPSGSQCPHNQNNTSGCGCGCDGHSKQKH